MTDWHVGQLNHDANLLVPYGGCGSAGAVTVDHRSGAEEWGRTCLATMGSSLLGGSSHCPSTDVMSDRYGRYKPLALLLLVRSSTSSPSSLSCTTKTRQQQPASRILGSNTACLDPDLLGWRGDQEQKQFHPIFFGRSYSPDKLDGLPYPNDICWAS